MQFFCAKICCWIWWTISAMLVLYEPNILLALFCFYQLQNGELYWLITIFQPHPLHVIDNDQFHNNRIHDTNNNDKKTPHKTCHFFKKMHSVIKTVPTTANDSFFALKERELVFKKDKYYVATQKVFKNNVLIKSNVLSIQEINKKSTRIHG